MAVANYNAIVALPGAYAIRFNASDAHQDYYEFNPAEGMLLNNFPAGMFSDTSIYWIERVRGAFDGVTATNDGGQSYVQVVIGFHRDSSVVAQNTFLGAMSNDASWILINETTEEWLMWPANGSAGGDLGSGFVTYQVIPSYIADTFGLGQRAVLAIAEDFDGIEPLIAGQVFQNGLINSELVVGLIPNNTFRPTFGAVARPVAATFPGVSGSLSAAVARATPATHAVAANFGGVAGAISAALQRQIATVNRPVAAIFSGAAGSLAAAVIRLPALTTRAVAANFPGAAGSLAAAVSKTVSRNPLRSFDSILADPFSTDAEVAMEYWAARPFSEIDVAAYRDILNPYRCPLQFLPELADLVQAYTWAPFMPEDYQRQAVADWWYYYRYRTTEAALRRWMDTIESLYSLRWVEGGNPLRKTELTVNMSDTPLVAVDTDVRQWEIDTVRRILGWPFMIDPINVTFARIYRTTVFIGMGMTIKHFKGW